MCCIDQAESYWLLIFFHSELANLLYNHVIYVHGARKLSKGVKGGIQQTVAFYILSQRTGGSGADK